MLEIKNISKTYRTGNLIQKALNNVSLNLRDNEFVAILGPSGSGKTTLLNIIGGLDRYDDGDLIINHISTKKYKDRDWDSYRNHTIGFVFQSYNLIPHQTVLANVEMALTISGISKKERKQRAIEALDKVGLKGQEHKKPNQMSGGQMQRVAIARALVNNPDILLADEPTGALDTKTSVQIMDLLKEVAKDRLVVMVSHNPELAEEYATRIVKIRDGQITDDSDPYIIGENDVEAVHKNLGKAKMGFLTALSLSFNNLLSKKGRTILTAFAGSIGIIGIALILALSTGFQNYIDQIQEETMSSYPLTIQKETSNVFSALLSARIEGNKDIEEGKVKEQMMISSMMNSVGSNDLTSFKKWLEANEHLYKDDVKNISYAYSVSPRIYTKDVTGAYVQLNPNTIMSSIYSDGVMSMMSSFSAGSSAGTFSSYDFDKLADNTELLLGDYPKNYDEVLIVLSEKNKISDLLVYSLGLRDNKELKTLITDVMAGEESSIKNEPLTFSYEDLMAIDLKLVNVTDLYKYNAKYDTYENMTNDDDFMADVFAKSETLKITGIAVSNEDSNLAGVIYSKDLVGHVIDVAKDSPIVKKQLTNKEIDVFSGKRFDEKEEKAGLDFNDMVTVDEDMLKNAFKVNIDVNDLAPDTDKLKDITASMIPTLTKQTFTDAADVLWSTYLNVMADVHNEYFSLDENNTFDEQQNKYIFSLTSDIDTFISDYNKKPNIENIINKAFEKYNFSIDMLGKDMKPQFIAGYQEIAKQYLTALKTTVTTMSMLNPTFELDGNTLNSLSEATINTIMNGADMPTGDHIQGIKELDLTKNAVETFSYVLVNANLGIDIGKKAGELIEVSLKPLTKLGNASNSKDGFMTIDTDAFAKAFNFNMDEDEVSRLMSSMMTGSSASYSNNLINLGFQDEDDPTSISLFFNDFESKENFLELLKQYNENAETEEKEIQYSDITGMLISSVQTIVNAVTYVLIAFVSISLVVSSIMIAIITLISVMERTKEIGILRAMGASKRNISSIFNAETFIIGLLSGLIGVTVSWAATFPINKIIHKVTDINDINSVLELRAAIILVIISVVLTMIAGFIPSKKAAKQDPVIALRSE